MSLCVRVTEDFYPVIIRKSARSCFTATEGFVTSYKCTHELYATIFVCLTLTWAD